MSVYLLLTGDNLSYVNEHRWPPLSYEQAIEQYRREYLDSEETEEKGAAGVETKRKGRKGVGLHTVLGLVGRLRL